MFASLHELIIAQSIEFHDYTVQATNTRINTIYYSNALVGVAIVSLYRVISVDIEAFY